MRASGAKTYAKILVVVGLLRDYGFDIPSRYVKHIDGKVWELRIDRYRVLYVANTGRRFVLLRAFSKKTDKTPASEIKIARTRLKSYLAQKQKGET